MSTVEIRQDEIRKARTAIREQVERSWPKPPPVPSEALDRISYWQWIAELAEAEMVNAIDSAKAGGATWMDIGTAFERSAEGARQFKLYRDERS